MTEQARRKRLAFSTACQAAAAASARECAVALTTPQGPDRSAPPAIPPPIGPSSLSRIASSHLFCRSFPLPSNAADFVPRSHRTQLLSRVHLIIPLRSRPPLFFSPQQ